MLHNKIYPLYAKIFIICILVCFSGALEAQRSVSMDKYGGNEKVQTLATGFFRTKKINNYWYFITPEGHPFISIGVNGLRYKNYSDIQYSKNVKNKYKSKIRFLNTSIALLKKWHFNTLGGWSEIDKTRKVERMPYTIILSLLAKATSFSEWKKMELPDIFSKKFRTSVIKNSKSILENHKKDPYLLGYFTDNEPRFSWLLPKSGDRMYALDWYLGLKSGLAARSEGRKAAVKFIRKRYNDSYRAFSANWKTNAKSFNELIYTKHLTLEAKHKKGAESDRNAFTKYLIENYYKIVTPIIHKYDHNHLILGIRFGNAKYAIGAIQANVEYSDVTSINLYTDSLNNKKRTEIFHRACKNAKGPVLISEFTFRAKELEYPTSKSKLLPYVDTPQDRIKAYNAFIRSLLKSRCVVGFHWFRWEDRPLIERNSQRGNNFSGNVGLVSVKDEPWVIFTNGITKTNKSIYKITNKLRSH